MASEELTYEAVMGAVAEFRDLGRAEFLKRYGFKAAREYVLLIDGVEYDSKPIAAVAHKYLPHVGRALSYKELSGGTEDTVARLLAAGFEVRLREEDRDWTWDEHVLALHFYKTNPARIPGKTSEDIRELSALLQELGRRAGVHMSPTYRNPNGVYMKLMNFRRLDPEFTAAGKKGLSRGAKGEKLVWDAFADDLDGLTRAANAIRLAIADPGVQLDVAGDDYEADEGAIVLRLHASRERDRKLIAKKKAQVLANHGALKCEVCTFDFADRYGELGKNFIEAHHRKPVSSLKAGEKTRLADLALVCANCHRMLHSGGDVLGIDDLRAALVAQGGS